MNGQTPQVDGYIRKSEQWQAELRQLRSILLGAGLTEEVKWRVPCYTFQGGNVAFIGRFKTACVLSFVKGALLRDDRRILIQQTEHSQSVRVVRFADVDAIVALEPVLGAYLAEAIEAERCGAKVALKTTSEFAVPDEFRAKLARVPALRAAFAALTPGRQRGYLLHFATAKQSKTRAARVEKCVQRIMDGKGLDDE